MAAFIGGLEIGGLGRGPGERIFLKLSSRVPSWGFYFSHYCFGGCSDWFSSWVGGECGCPVVLFRRVGIINWGDNLWLV